MLNFIFSFAPRPFNGEHYEKRSLELVTSSFFSNISPGNFDDLILSGFWVFPKIMFVNLCKAIHDNIIIPVSPDPLNLENVERRESN